MREAPLLASQIARTISAGHHIVRPTTEELILGREPQLPSATRRVEDVRLGLEEVPFEGMYLPVSSPMTG